MINLPRGDKEFLEWLAATHQPPLPLVYVDISLSLHHKGQQRELPYHFERERGENKSTSSPQRLEGGGVHAIHILGTGYLII